MRYQDDLFHDAFLVKSNDGGIKFINANDTTNKTDTVRKFNAMILNLHAILQNKPPNAGPIHLANDANICAKPLT